MGGSSHPTAGETRAPLALLEGESVLGVSASLLAPPRSPARREANANTLQFVSFKQELPLQTAQVCKGSSRQQMTHVCTSSHFTHLWDLFVSLQSTSSSPHALGLLLEKLSDAERPGHDSPGCFWGRGAALGEWQDQPPLLGFTPSPHRTASKGHSPQQFLIF